MPLTVKGNEAGGNLLPSLLLLRPTWLLLPQQGTCLGCQGVLNGLLCLLGCLGLLLLPLCINLGQTLGYDRVPFPACTFQSAY
jgi:hypothetical protein